MASSRETIAIGATRYREAIRHRPTSRLSRLRTVVAYHRPPRAVRIPRLFSALAIPSRDVIPSARIASTTGSTSRANLSALARLLSAPAVHPGLPAPTACNATRLGLPSRLPLALAAANAAFV